MTFAAITALILGGALLQPFGGGIAARPYGDGNLVGTWRDNLPGQRLAGLGVWSHSHGKTYKAIWDGFIQFDSPPPGTLKRGVQRLNWDIELDGDQAAFESKSQFLDINGNVLANTCASGTLMRIEISQDQA